MKRGSRSPTSIKNKETTFIPVEFFHPSRDLVFHNLVWCVVIEGAAG